MQFVGPTSFSLEFNREKVKKSRLISNPGCYATAAQLCIRPMLSHLDKHRFPVVFGVSGYSGAGTTPSSKNDPERLRDNMIPYSLTGHIHEREIWYQSGLGINFGGVSFVPHVASWFRGLSVTVVMGLSKSMSSREIRNVFKDAYRDEPLIVALDAGEIPEVTQIAGQHGAIVGGYAVSEDGKKIVMVGVLDNLLKGAATQAIQNINLSLQGEELAGIKFD